MSARASRTRIALPLLAGVLLCTLLCIRIAFREAGGWASRGPAYSVAEIRALLAREPAAWAGRVVRIRAVAEPCPLWGSQYARLRCATLRPDLADPEGSDLADPLPLTPDSGGTLLSALSRLPFVGALAHRQWPPEWGVLRTYAVRLQPTAHPCGEAHCFEAVLVEEVTGWRNALLGHVLVSRT